MLKAKPASNLGFLNPKTIIATEQQKLAVVVKENVPNSPWQNIFETLSSILLKYYAFIKNVVLFLFCFW